MLLRLYISFFSLGSSSRCVTRVLSRGIEVFGSRCLIVFEMGSIRVNGIFVVLPRFVEDIRRRKAFERGWSATRGVCILEIRIQMEM